LVIDGGAAANQYKNRRQLNVRLALKATELPRRREMSRCAISGLMHRNKTVLFDHLVGDHVPSDGASSRYPNPGLHDHPLVGQIRSSGI
jgi:hypothetical protein